MKKLLAVFFLFFIPLIAAARSPATTEGLLETRLKVQVLPVRMDAIPIGATRVKLLPLVFTASCNADVELKHVRISKIGPGNSADIKGVYVLNEDTRITRSGVFSADDKTVFLGLKGFRIPACKTIRLDIAVDIDRGATSGGRFILTIDKPEDLATTATTMDAIFPLRTFEDASKVVPEPVGEAVVEFIPISGAVSAIRDEIFAKFSIKADGDANQQLYGITLTNAGSASNDELRNMYITRHRGRALTQIVRKLKDDSVTFRFSQPYFLAKGQKVAFELRGNAYTTAKTINFILKDHADLDARTTRLSGRKTGGKAQLR